MKVPRGTSGGARLRPVGLGAVLGLAALASGCGTVDSILTEVFPRGDTNYRPTTAAPRLEVPPDLSSSSIRDAYRIPSDGSATLSEYESKAGAKGQVLPNPEDVRIERSGDKQWLVVRATPGELWPRLRRFWLDNDFFVELDDPAIGIMETAWAESKAEVEPEGTVKRLLGKLGGGDGALTTRDKFRVRLEWGTEVGTTEVFVAHRGAAEQDGDWVPRPSDPELEAEILHRLVVALGVERRQADELLAEGRSQAARAHLVKDADGGTVLALREGFSGAWRRTGLALDRVGFTVQDRDRSRGLFYVRYVDPLAGEVGERTEKGWLQKLKFWGKEESAAPEHSEFLISLVGGGSTTKVLVLDKSGQRDFSGTGDRILALLHDELK